MRPARRRSLNLAYHGARAEKQGFTITLERSFDPTAGEVDLFPQEITRALLNLISNGFYAATKRKAEANGGNYEPTLAATTKNLGDRVEIRIRDNGTGIVPEVREKLFNPFFTTKPAGEGTGLGLSISHDIIVKQHGGSIKVDTKPGDFTEFRIVLPRAERPSQVGRTHQPITASVVLSKDRIAPLNLPDFVAVHEFGPGPFAWSGRASQEVFVDLSDVGLASMYPASHWSVSCSGPPWISARMRSH